MSEIEVVNENTVNEGKTITDKSGKRLNFEDVNDLPEVMRRLKALKKLQFEKLEVNGEFEKEILDLMKNKFYDKYKSLNQKRSKIIDGSVEPTEEDCDFELDSQESGPSIEVKDSKVDGIPGFWLRAMQSFSRIRNWISREDEFVLYYLIDIAVNFNENLSKLIFEFKFGPNEYFSNEVLTKEYEIRFGPDPEDPWEMSSYFAVKRKGCQIDWAKGKNPMKEMERAKKSVLDFDEIPSFFCFFNPPEEPEDKNKVDTKSLDLVDYLWEDWEIALIFVQSLVPNAVLYYTGDLEEEEEEETDSSEESNPISDSDSDSDDSETNTT